jgi:hypothetical protein
MSSRPVRFNTLSEGDRFTCEELKGTVLVCTRMLHDPATDNIFNTMDLKTARPYYASAMLLATPYTGEVAFLTEENGS